ncbi:hypothetical protein LCGC14_2802150, partial [marine sediment metagenome]
YVHIIRNVISLSIPIFMRTLDSQVKMMGNNNRIWQRIRLSFSLPTFCVLGLLLIGYLPSAVFAVDLHYDLFIDNPDSGEGIVRITVSDLDSDTFQVGEHGFYEGLRANFLSPSAFDSSGNPLPITIITKKGRWGKVWKVHSSGYNQISIEYTFKPKKDRCDFCSNPIYYGYISSNFAVFLGEWALALPLPENPHIRRITASFSVPQGGKSLAHG